MVQFSIPLIRIYSIYPNEYCTVKYAYMFKYSCVILFHRKSNMYLHFGNLKVTYILQSSLQSSINEKWFLRQVGWVFPERHLQVKPLESSGLQFPPFLQGLS